MIRKLGHAYFVPDVRDTRSVIGVLRNHFAGVAVVDMVASDGGWLVITAAPLGAKQTARSATKEPLDVVEQLAASPR